MKLLIKSHNLRHSVVVGDTYVTRGGTLELIVDEIPDNVTEAVRTGQISYKVIEDEPKLVRKPSRRHKSSVNKFIEGDDSLNA